MNKQLHEALVSHLLNKADDTDVPNAHNEHASAADNVHTGVEYFGNAVHTTDEPTKISDVVFFGIVKGW